jgi:hypothetical protein
MVEMKMPALGCAICTCCCLCCGMSFPGLAYIKVPGDHISLTPGLFGTYAAGDDHGKQSWIRATGDADASWPGYKAYDGCSPDGTYTQWPFLVKDATQSDYVGAVKSFCNATRGLYVWTFILSFFALCANAGGMMMPMLNYVAAVLHLLTGFFAMVTFAYFANRAYDPTDSYSLSYSFVILVIFWLVAWLTAGLSAMAAMNAGSSDEAPPASEAATEEIPDGGAAVTAKV